MTKEETVRILRDVIFEVETRSDDNNRLYEQRTKLNKRIQDLEAECSGLRNELADLQNDNMRCHANVESVNVQLAQLKQALEIEVSKKKPMHYWEVTVKLTDGRLGTYSISDWPHHIKADEVLRPDVTLSLHRVVR